MAKAFAKIDAFPFSNRTRNRTRTAAEGVVAILDLAGLETQTQNAAFFERKGPKRKPWPRGKSLNRKKTIAMCFLNASVLERKALNRNLLGAFH